MQTQTCRKVRCTVALSECRRATAWQLATELLARLSLLRLMPDAVTCGAAVSCLARAAQWEGALEVLKSARQQQVQILTLSLV